VEFNEITKRAVEEAFKHPRDINMDLVNAQQARRILDRIVGYNLSPLLWKKVGRGLSAGRVQSVAVRLVVDREKQIRAFKPEEYWSIEAKLRSPRDKKTFIAKLDKIEEKSAKIENKQQSDNILEELKKEKFTVNLVKESQRKRNPSAPFITSSLQQEAFNKLRFPVGKTMRIAQQLYEGIEIGKEGSVGLITYMRTDSVRVAQEAIKDARDFIQKKYSKEYLPQKPNVYKVKKAAQQAHEAVRPTSAARDPDSVKKFLTPEQYKLYELIWRRFVSSQMSPAVILLTTAKIEAGKYIFKASGSRLMFPGFSVLYAVEKKEKEPVLPKLVVNDVLELLGLDPQQHFTKPPPRYSDASLVRALEEKGIGRPSTYAPIIFTVVQRNYVRREGGYLYPTELGEAVIGLLVSHFKKILDVKFTAGMEEELDKVEEGKVDWVQVLKEFYKSFMERLVVAQAEMKSLKKEVVQTDEICPECGAPMVIKWSRSGKFLSCSKFPECRFAKSITTGVKCPSPDCDGELVRRKSKRGYFYGCSKYPKCKYVSKNLPARKEETGKEETGKDETKKEET
jgi:DNA topoisomerase-1